MGDHDDGGIPIGSLPRGSIDDSVAPPAGGVKDERPSSASGWRIDGEEVRLERSVCAFCASDETGFIVAGRDRLCGLPGEFMVVACMRCGLMRTDPRPTRESIRLYYPSNYPPYAETTRETRNIARRLGRRLFDPLDVATPVLAPGRLLEIGCASGNFLVAMQTAGWEVTGVELDASAAQVATARTQHRVHQCSIEDQDFSAEAFDLISAWMVFEHLHDPVAQFRRCARWLRPGGWLAFSVPDCGGLQLRLFGKYWFSLELPRHLYHFTPPVLARILGACGFGNVQTMWQRTLTDVPFSLAYGVEDRIPHASAIVRTVAASMPIRALVRTAGVVAAPLRMTGRVTIWARKS